MQAFAQMPSDSSLATVDVLARLTRVGLVGQKPAKNATLIQVVPQRTEEPNGLTDYASALARSLREGNGIDSVFLSGAPSERAPTAGNEWKTISLPRRQGRAFADSIWALAAEVNVLAVVLHFVGYGYQKRGIPFWLANGIRIWRRRAPHLPLITIFHELYATGRPWQSAFWLSPAQKQITRMILNLSSAALTPTNLGRKQLLSWGRESDSKIITAMPVFSNVGEPGPGAPPSAREAVAVVFGLAGVEDRLFGVHRSAVEQIISAAGIGKLYDVGPRPFSVPSKLAGVPVISKGALPSHAVSELLRQARYGLIAYPIDVIGKSGVFAAYAAHGVVPIVLSDEERLASLEGLRPMRHFLDGLRLPKGGYASQLALIQDELFDWYASHTLRAQADFLARLATSVA